MQKIKTRVDLAYFRDVYNMLPNNQILPYIAEVENEDMGGVIALKYKDIIYGWQGGIKTMNTKLPVNDIIIWEIIKDSIKLGIKKFDIVGANTSRICSYKWECLFRTSPT